MSETRASKRNHRLGPSVRVGWSAASALLLLLQSHLCRADDTCEPGNPRLHRLSMVAGYGPAYYQLTTAGSERLRNKDPDFQLRASYGYIVTRGLELGGAVTIATNGDFTVLLPAGTVRGFLSLGDVEVGLNARLGAFANYTLGLSMAGGPDVRIWATPRVAFHLGATASAAYGASPEGGREESHLTFGAAELGVVIKL